MKASSVLCVLIALSVVMGGLGIIQVGADSENTVSSLPLEPEPKATVQRIVLMEDHTNWGCPPCAGYNPFLIPAVEDLGYSKVAPVMYHWYYPSADDPMDDYGELFQDPTETEVYYSRQNGDNNYVPNTYHDGIDTTEDWDYASCVAKINARLAVPSNMKIVTTGSINEVGLTGTVNIHVEVMETITNPSDMRLFAQLWENNITRPFNAVYPYPNGETEMKWACWDMLLTEDGYDVSSLNTIGEYIDIPVNFNFESSWVADELGVTVFVSHVTTDAISTEQAAVELFNNDPPVSSLVSPTPTLAEQVLSGTIPITWTATDTEDAQASLDISADYSVDGGATWVNIFSGTNNNVVPYTYNWNTVSAGIPDGTGFRVRVQATDSIGAKSLYATSIEAFSIENVVGDEWFFQVEASGSNKDLSVNPVENAPNTVASASISATGEYKISTWQTVSTFTGSNINGPWNFKTYGKTPNPGLVTLQASLYAKVFTSSNLVTPLDTTVYDDENVGAFTTSHLFQWTDTLAGTIVNGNSVVIEIWIHVTGGPYTQNSGATLNPYFNTSATPWTYYDSEDAGPGTATGSYQSAGGNPGGFVQIALVSESTGSGTTAYAYSGYYEQSFTTSFIPYVAAIAFDWKVVAANAVDPATQYFSIYVETATGIPSTSPVWTIESLASAPTAWTHVNVDISSKINAATTYYVKIAYRHDSLQKGDGTYTGGYDNVLLTYSRPYSIFYMEYDYGTTRSSVVPYIGTGAPVSVTANIAVVAGWNLVSIPIIATDNRLPYALTDTVNAGAGLVAWDRAIWYNINTPADPWKQFNKNWGASLNDLTSVNNSVGVWLYVTTVGDGIITVGGTNYTTPTTTQIFLKQGWNLVGFPSDDTTFTVALLKAATTNIVTLVEQFDGAQTYKTATMADGTALAQGKAYWVYASSGTIWTKAW